MNVEPTIRHYIVLKGAVQLGTLDAANDIDALRIATDRHGPELALFEQRIIYRQVYPHSTWTWETEAKT